MLQWVMPRKILPKKKCAYCKGIFEPISRGGSKPRFCRPECRKAYNKHGAMPFNKLVDRLQRQVEAEVTTALGPIMEQLLQIENRLLDVEQRD